MDEHFPRQAKRIAVVAGSERVSDRERYLLRELIRGTGATQIVFVTVRARPGITRALQKAAAGIVNAAGRHRPGFAEPPVAPDAVVTPITTDEPGLRAVLRDAALDLIIDLRRSPSPSDLAQYSGLGVLELWCNGHRENLEFESTFRSSAWHLGVSLTDANAAVPTMVWESRHIPASRVLAADRQLLAGRSVAYLVRAARGTHGVHRAVKTCVRPRRAVSYVSHALAAVIYHVVDRLWRILRTDEAWFIAVQGREGSRGITELSASDLVPFDPLPNGFVADPCVVHRDGADYVFYEEFRFADRRGVISCLQIESDGTFGQAREVLREPYHLSYPFVFEYDGEFYMIPESSANRTIDLYRAAAFPWTWERVRTLIDDVNAVDSTLHFDGKRWWLFCSIGEHGGSTWDELFLFHAASLHGPWQRHANSPVKSDASSARPAGRLWVEDGQLYRPAQDCSLRYGGGIAICRIDVLSPVAFDETVVRRIPAESLDGCDGFHTISCSPEYLVIDARWRDGVRRAWRRRPH